ncbi:response regulator transcription factor [Gemmatimonas aurantiaca]|uniref:response regulator transcription factor n=1 Tax=Gemmatimonas aurantiaca TaxID=173480 RepID=UPI00301BD961
MSTRIRIVLVDDHALVRRGLALLLRLEGRHEIIGEAGSGEAALPLIESERPDLVILDLNMPGMDGLETLRRLRARGIPTRVLVLSMHDETHLVGEALTAGADGYLLKDSMDDELFLAIDGIMRGQRYLAAAIDRARLQESRLRPMALTAREREVLQLIANGLTTSAVAETLNISPHTATRHRANLMQKLNVHNQVELVRIAVGQGLIVLQTPT